VPRFISGHRVSLFVDSCTERAKLRGVRQHLVTAGFQDRRVTLLFYCVPPASHMTDSTLDCQSVHSFTDSS